MTNFQLKILALIFMTIDHIGYFVPIDKSYTPHLVMRMIGRLSFPIFLFLILEGYKHTSNKKKYVISLYIFALISTFPFYYCFGTISNVFFTLGTVVLMLLVFEKYANCAYNYIIFLVFMYASFPFDWGLPAIITVFFLRHSLYDTKKTAVRLPIYLALSTTLYYSITGTIQLSTFYFIIPILGSIPLLLRYNGKLGFKLSGYKKYLMYGYYPLHLLIIGLIVNFI